jgi:hypothetical protein
MGKVLGCGWRGREIDCSPRQQNRQDSTTIHGLLLSCPQKTKDTMNRFLFPMLAFAVLLPLLALGQAGLARPVPSDAEVVRTGVYLMNLYDLNINEHSFYADFYLWFKWKGERDPMNIEFVNAIEKWGFTQNNFHEEPLLLEDGYYYNGMRIEGRFYHPFALDDFPLDRHALDIYIENVEYAQDSLVYLPDTAATFIRDGFAIPGWWIAGAEMHRQENVYRTDFGETGIVTPVFSSFAFNLHISRPRNYFLFKLMLPLLIVIIASLGALFIHPAQLDARISLPIGGLLTAVFLQQSYNSALPDVGYMVLMDKIYLLGYALIVSVLLRVILAANTVAAVKKKEVDLPRLRRGDRWMATLALAVFLLGVAILAASSG